MTDLPAPLTDEQLHDRIECAIGLTQDCGGTAGVHAVRDAVLAVVQPELDRLRAELADQEHQAEMYHGRWQSSMRRREDERAELRKLRAALTAVESTCTAAEHQATRWEQPLPVPEWVAAVRAATDGHSSCPDPIECDHGAEVGRLRAAVENLIPEDPSEDANASWIPARHIRAALNAAAPAPTT